MGSSKKKIINSSPVVTEYYLTRRGRSLNRVIYELAVFSLENCNDVEYYEESTRIKIKQNFRDTLKIND